MIYMYKSNETYEKLLQKDVKLEVYNELKRQQISDTKENNRYINCKFSKETFKIIYILSQYSSSDILMRKI